jgi:hypothetical protein
MAMSRFFLNYGFKNALQPPNYPNCLNCNLHHPKPNCSTTSFTSFTTTPTTPPMPSTECNRTLIYVGSILQAVGGLAIMSFASAAINQDPIVEKIWWMVDGGAAFLVTMVVVAVLLIVLSLLGVCGAKTREKEILLCFYFSAFVFILVRLIYTSVMFETLQPSELTALVPSFQQQWLDLVATSKTNMDSVDAKRAVAFMTYINDKGDCCGFDDATSIEQNPVSLNCTSVDPCQATFLIEFRAAIEKQCIIIFVFATLEAVTLLIMCGMTCRYKKAPAFQKVKNGVGSVRRV